MGETFDTPRYYAALDVVVLPTYREGFPNVALEAAAMALPVVATKIPGCVDAVVDGQTGILVPARDAESLAAAMLRLADDPDYRQALGQSGRERVVRDFKPAVIWEALLAEYQSEMAMRGVCS